MNEEQRASASIRIVLLLPLCQGIPVSVLFSPKHAQSAGDFTLVRSLSERRPGDEETRWRCSTGTSQSHLGTTSVDVEDGDPLAPHAPTD